MSTQAKNTPCAFPNLSAPDPVFATILVGSNRKRFVVHQSVLVHYSDFFRAALTGKFAEATKKIVTLEEDDPDVFEFFVHWLYFGRCPSEEKGDDEPLADRFYDSSDTPTLLNVVKLYVFADKYGVARLRKGLVDLVFNIITDDTSVLPGSMAISCAFGHLEPTDPMCRLLVDLFWQYIEFDYIDECAEYNCVPFLQAMWFRFMHSRPCFSPFAEKSTPFCVKLCDYHEHDMDEDEDVCGGLGIVGDII